MIKRLLNNHSRTITSAATVLGASFLISRLLGLLRDRLLAGTFGAGDELDIYYAAFRIPDLVYNLLVIGALSAGFIPVFTSFLKKKQSDFSMSEAWYLANGVLNILFVALIIICGVLVVFTPWLMKLITPGFSGEKMAQLVLLARFMFLSPIFLGISSVLGGILQSFKKFFLFSLSPIFYNLGIISGILLLSGALGILGATLGVVFGAFLHMLILVPGVYRSGFHYRWVFDLAHQGIKKISRLMVPRVLALAVSQLNFLAITILASTLLAGSLAIFNLAYNIWSFPLGIFATSLAVAAFPSLSEWAQTKNWAKFKKVFSSTFRQIIFLIIPASAFFIVLRAQIVRVILGSGKFDWQDTVLTINTLLYLTLGLFAEALILLLVRCFFVLEDTKTPFLLGITSSAIRIFAAWAFSCLMGVEGLALGFSIGSVCYFVLLWFFLKKKVKVLAEKEIFVSGLKIIIAALVAASASYGALWLIGSLVNLRTGLGILTQGFVAGLIGLALYVILGLALRSPETKMFWQGVVARLPWRKVAPKEITFE